MNIEAFESTCKARQKGLEEREAAVKKREDDLGELSSLLMREQALLSSLHDLRAGLIAELTSKVKKLEEDLRTERAFFKRILESRDGQPPATYAIHSEDSDSNSAGACVQDVRHVNHEFTSFRIIVGGKFEFSRHLVEFLLSELLE